MFEAFSDAAGLLVRGLEVYRAATLIAVLTQQKWFLFKTQLLSRPKVSKISFLIQRKKFCVCARTQRCITFAKKNHMKPQVQPKQAVQLSVLRRSGNSAGSCFRFLGGLDKHNMDPRLRVTLLRVSPVHRDAVRLHANTHTRTHTHTHTHTHAKIGLV